LEGLKWCGVSKVRGREVSFHLWPKWRYKDMGGRCVKKKRRMVGAVASRNEGFQLKRIHFLKEGVKSIIVERGGSKGGRGEDFFGEVTTLKREGM